MVETELPTSWLWTTLENITTPTRISVQPMDYPMLPFVGMEHVEAETMKLIGTVPARELKSMALHFYPGDVLYGRLRPYLNKVLKIDFEGLCSAEFLVFRESRGLEARYLQYFFNSWHFKEFASHLNEGDRPRVDWNQLKGFDFPLPPFTEQQRIVAAIEQQFTRLDAGIAALKSIQTRLKCYRTAVLKAAVEGKLTEAWRAEHPNIESISEARERILNFAKPISQINSRRRLWGAGHVIDNSEELKSTLPASWELVKVRDLNFSSNAVQIGPMSMKSNEFTSHGVPVLNVGCVKWGYFDVSKVNFLPEELASKFDRYRIKVGDVVFTRSGTVGRCAVVREEQDNWLITFHLLRVRVDTHICLPEYLAYVFEGAPHVLSQITSAAVGSTRAGFNTRLLEELDIPLPSLEEQHEILAELERRLSIVSELEATVEANLKRAERMRQSILKAAFAGRLVSQDPDDEPASALLERIRQEREAQSEQRQSKQHSRQEKSKKAREQSTPQTQYVLSMREQEPEQIDSSELEQVALWNGIAD